MCISDTLAELRGKKCNQWKLLHVSASTKFENKNELFDLK